MKPVECEFEADALAAALQSRWPERVNDDLRAHVAGCAICSDVVAIASAMDDAREDLRTHAVVPDSGRVWWLAQIRARREAAETAGRPISAVQVVAFGCAVGLLGACFGATSAWFQSALRWIAGNISSTAALFVQHGAFVLAAALVLFLVPTAVFLALGKD
jgi:hypothetical protein